MPNGIQVVDVKIHSTPPISSMASNNRPIIKVFTTILLLLFVSSLFGQVENAKKHLEKARQGDANAQYALGILYGDGVSVVQNYTKAYMWTSLAIAQMAGKKQDLAISVLNVIANRMTTEQIANAQRLARKWNPRKTCEHTLHPAGHPVDCKHRLHPSGDRRRCRHSCFFGGRYSRSGSCHPAGDLVSCKHRTHANGDSVPCTHPAHPEGH